MPERPSEAEVRAELARYPAGAVIAVHVAEIDRLVKSWQILARSVLADGDARSLLADLTWQFALHETDHEGNSTGWVSTGAMRDIKEAFRYFGVPERCEVETLRKALFGETKP